MSTFLRTMAFAAGFVGGWELAEPGHVMIGVGLIVLDVVLLILSFQMEEPA